MQRLRHREINGLYNALYDAGITINDVDPDYVVVGETVTYGYEHIITAMNLVNKGARLIATNTDITGPNRRWNRSCMPRFRCPNRGNYR